MSTGLRAVYKQTEVGVIPEDWDAVPLSAIGQFKNGINKGAEAFGHGSPFVNLMDVFGVSSIKSGDGLGLVKTSEPEQKTYDLKRGDVIFIRSSVKPSGVGLTAVVEADLPKTVYSGFLIRFRESDALDIGFKRHCFYAEKFRSKLIGASSVSANTNINQDNLKKLLIALPPIPEQRAIAAALSDVDALLGGLDRLITKKQGLKVAAIQQLLTGQTRLPGFSGEWEVKRLGEITDIDPDNLGSNTPSDYEFNYISLENVDRGVLVGFSEQVFNAAPSRARRTLKSGDVLVSTVRPNLQSHLLFNLDAPHWVCSTGFAVVRCRTGITNPAYVFPHLFGSGVSRQIETILTGSNYPAINSKDVRALEIPIPPYAEQTAIADVLSDMDAELAALQARRSKTQALKQAMMQQLLTGRIRLV